MANNNETHYDDLLVIIESGWQGSRYDTKGVTFDLIEAGYRRPRTIDTQSGLDALPEKSVIRDAYGFVAEKDRKPYSDWYATGDDEPFLSIEFPVTVLWEASDG